MKWYKKYKIELIIFLLAFVIQTTVTIFHINHTGNITSTFTRFGGDSLEHLSLAQTIWQRHAFISTEVGVPPNFLETIRMPLYPFIAGAILSAVKGNLAVGIIFLHLFGACGMVLLYRLMRLLVSPSAAFVGTLIGILDLERVFLADQFATENLFFIFFFGGIYFVIRYLQEMKIQNISTKPRNLLLFAAILFAFGTLTRVFVLYIMLLSILLLGAYALFLAYKKHYPLKTNIRNLSFATLLFFAIIFPWSARNYYHFETFQLSASRQWNTYYRNLVRLYEYQRGIHGGSHEAINQELDEQFYRDTGADRNFTIDEAHLKNFKYGAYVDQKMNEALANHRIQYATLAVRRFIPWALDSSISSTVTYIDSNFFLLTPTFTKMGISLFPMVFYGTRAVWAMLYLFVAVMIFIHRKRFIGNWSAWVYLLMLVLLTGYGAEWSFTTRHKLPFILMFYSMLVFCVELLRDSIRRTRSSEIHTSK